MTRLPPEQWTSETKTRAARRWAACYCCRRRPDSLDPLPDTWGWDTLEPDSPYLWCPACIAGEDVERVEQLALDLSPGGSP